MNENTPSVESQETDRLIEEELEEAFETREAMRLHAREHLMQGAKILVINAIQSGLAGTEEFKEIPESYQKAYYDIQSGGVETGDHSAIMIEKLGLDPNDKNIHVWHPWRGEERPDIDIEDVDLVIGTGSEAMPSRLENEPGHPDNPGVDLIRKFFVETIKNNTPGIVACGTHQMYALAAGGRVGRMKIVDGEKDQREYGVQPVEFDLSNIAKDHPLYRELGGQKYFTLHVQASHSEGVTERPEKAKIVGFSDKDPNKFLDYGGILSFQDHPEITRLYSWLNSYARQEALVEEFGQEGFEKIRRQILEASTAEDALKVLKAYVTHMGDQLSKRK